MAKVEFIKEFATKKKGEIAEIRNPLLARLIKRKIVKLAETKAKK